MWNNRLPGSPTQAQIDGTWTTTIQPYLKNVQVLFDPSFSIEKRYRAYVTPPCGNVNPSAVARQVQNPATRWLSHYGMSFIFNLNGCTQQRPYARFPGSGFLGGVPTVRVLAEIQRPAETANIGDAVTIVRGDTGNVASGFGCQAMFAHFEGGNFVFLDGHAKFIKGNIEEYIEQDGAGCWYMKFLTYDK